MSILKVTILSECHGEINNLIKLSVELFIVLMQTTIVYTCLPASASKGASTSDLRFEISDHLQKIELLGKQHTLPSRYPGHPSPLCMHALSQNRI